MKRVIITFDYEGVWGMPYADSYDLGLATDRILDVLSAHQARAVFFVVGKLVDEHPEIITRLHAAGHEIGLHGYLHEHMDNLSNLELQSLEAQFHATAAAVEQLTGYRPRGFRAPYLMGPLFYDARLYAWLSVNGFTWASNREIRMPEELFRFGWLQHGLGLLKLGWMRRILLVALNLRLIVFERRAGKSLKRPLRWLLDGTRPFARAEGIVEYPLSSPLDCDLVGLPHPDQVSSQSTLDYARLALESCLQSADDTVMLSCHDWIVGSANRLAILEQSLVYVAAHGGSYYLPGRAEGATQ